MVTTKDTVGCDVECSLDAEKDTGTDVFVNNGKGRQVKSANSGLPGISLFPLMTTETAGNKSYVLTPEVTTLCSDPCVGSCTGDTVTGI